MGVGDGPADEGSETGIGPAQGAGPTSGSSDIQRAGYADQAEAARKELAERMEEISQVSGDQVREAAQKLLEAAHHEDRAGH